MNYTREQLLRTLDVAVLRPNATVSEIMTTARAADRLGLASVCVNPINVKIATGICKRVCSVVGFPHGNTYPVVKVQEAGYAVVEGAREIDFVLNYGRFLSGDLGTVEQEIKYLTKLCKPRGIVLKAILETCYLTPPQIDELCKLCVAGGVDFVKTSTGFGDGGATAGAVAVMLNAVKGSNVQVKASGGISTYEDACKFLDMGCTRLGVGYTKWEGILPR
ncbi:MAG: deoxyribose-phosphate aldolase [Thermoguttaceae bacterium]